MFLYDVKLKFPVSLNPSANTEDNGVACDINPVSEVPIAVKFSPISDCSSVSVSNPLESIQLTDISNTSALIACCGI